MNEAAEPMVLRASSTAADPPAQPTERRPQTHAYVILAAAAYLVFWQVAPRIRSDSLGAVLVSTVLSLALIVWFPAEFARVVHSRRALAYHALAAAVINLPLRFGIFGGHVLAPWSYLELIPGLPGLLFIWFAAAIGTSLSRILRSANLIPPVAAVLALVDIWTVMLGGPVQQIMQSSTPAAQAVARAMTVRLPAPTTTAGATPLRLDVGFADFLFIAFFVAAICRFTDPARTFKRALGALILVLCAYSVIVMFSQWALPALVPMSIVMIALHWRRFHYQRSEVFALLYAGLFIAVIAAGFWLFARGDSPRPRQRAEIGILASNSNTDSICGTRSYGLPYGRLRGFGISDYSDCRRGGRV